MSETASSRLLVRVAGIAMFGLGLAVFLIRLQHAGGYDPPEGGNLLGALLALGVGGAWLRDGFGAERLARPLVWLAWGISPIALFLALYATLAEVEEVVVIDARDGEGRAMALRFWIVDRDDGEWITMQEGKALEYGLGTGPLSLLRKGERSCRIAMRHDDYETVDAIVQLRYERYLVQRLATAVGLFGRHAGATTVALQLTPCAKTTERSRDREERAPMRAL